MKHHLAKKMYKIHGFCFDPCTVEMEVDLKAAGLYEAYEKRLMQGNIKAFASDIEQWVDDFVNAEMSFVTEQGDVEDWNSNDDIKKRVLTNLKTYLGHLKDYM